MEAIEKNDWNDRSNKVTKEELINFYFTSRTCEVILVKKNVAIITSIKGLYFIIIRAAQTYNLVLNILASTGCLRQMSVMQSSRDIKCLAKKDENGEWFLNFVS